MTRLNRTMQYGNYIFKDAEEHTLKRFKSYYVVWKPDNKMENKMSVDGLNRTMQYGNFINASFCATACWFKSYYVVWKLEKKLTREILFKCLNRTMQYGNPPCESPKYTSDRV